MKIEIKGIEELSNKLRALADGKLLSKVVAGSRARLMRRLAQYPAASTANRPKPAPGRWYERGWGTRSATGRGRRSSEKLGSSWVAREQGQGLLIRNTASYAPLVMGAKRQTALHGRRGWSRVEELLAEEGKRVEADLVKAVGEVLDG